MFLQGVTIACCGAEALAGEVTHLLAPSQMLPRIFGARTLRTRLSLVQSLTFAENTCRPKTLLLVDKNRQIMQGDAADAVQRLVDPDAITRIVRRYQQGRTNSAAERCLRITLFVPSLDFS